MKNTEDEPQMNNRTDENIQQNPDIGSDKDGPDSPQKNMPSELEKAKTESENLKDQLLRKIAEFENYKRRTRDEQNQLVLFATEGLILDLLPVLDDFSRSLNYGKEHPDFDSFYSGIEIIRTKLMKLLEQRGLKPIEAAGKPFDVEYHDALMQIPDPNTPPGMVVNEVETGYMLNNRVIRHAKVTVSADTAANNEALN